MSSVLHRRLLSLVEEGRGRFWVFVFHDRLALTTYLWYCVNVTDVVGILHHHLLALFSKLCLLGHDALDLLLFGAEARLSGH